MTPRRTWFYVGVLTLILIIVAWLAAHSDPTQQIRFDAASVVLLVTAAAVGIERILEVIWTVVGLTKGSAWPMNLLGEKLDHITNQLSDSLKPYTDAADSLLSDLAQKEQWTAAEIQEAQGYINRLSTLTTTIKETANDKEQLQTLAGAAAQYVSYIQARYTAFADAATKDASKNQGEKDAAAAKEKARSEAEAKERTQAEQLFADLEEEKRKTKIDEHMASQIIQKAIELAGEYAYNRSMAQSLLKRATEEQVVAAKFVAARSGNDQAAIEKAGKDAQADVEQKIKAARQQAEAEAKAEGMSGEELKDACDRAAGDAANALLNANPARNIGLAVNLATSGIQGLTDFVATFKDNPGRRLVSLYVASLLGLCLGGWLGLDVFQAILGTPTANGSAAHATTAPLELGDALVQFIFAPLHAGVVLTGLLIGLGSNPTHEVIRVLQEYKKSRLRLNAPDAATVDIDVVDTLFDQAADAAATQRSLGPSFSAQAAPRRRTVQVIRFR